MRTSGAYASCIASFWLCGCSLLVDADAKNLGPDRSSVSGNGVAADDAGSGQNGEDAGESDSCSSCDDGIACTVDSCAGDSECVNTPDIARCGAGERCSASKGCVALRCTENSDCDDGDPCTGDERCDPEDPAADMISGCIAGTPPTCDDDIACTGDRCEKGVGCQHTTNNARCNDDVACTVDTCSATKGCINDPSNVRCNFCQPGSRCSADLGCIGGFPRNCDDGDSCTQDFCDAEQLECTNVGSCEVGPDSCAEAQRIVIENGRGVAGGTFERVSSTYDTTCGSAGGRDAVYQFTVDAVSDIVLDTTIGSARTVLAVAGDCSEGGFGLACAGAVSSDEERGSRLVIHRYDPNVRGTTLFVLVDGIDSQERGEYVLTVNVLPVAADSCNTALSLGEGGTLLGFMDALQPPNAWGQQLGTCQVDLGAGSAPEAIVRVQGARDRRLSLTAISNDFAPTMYVRANCAVNAELGCATSPLPGTVKLDVDLAQDQEAFVLIDGGRDGGSYLLRSLP